MPIRSAAASMSPVETSDNEDDWCAQTFSVSTPTTFVLHSELCFLESLDEILVIEGLSFSSHAVIAGRAPPCTLTTWMNFFELPPRGQQSDRPPGNVLPRGQAAKDLIAQHPWLEEHLKSDAGRGHGGGDGIGGRDDVDAEEVIRVSRAAMDHDLEAMRANVTTDDFFLRYRLAGSWDAGSGVGSLSTEPKRGMPRAFCTQYKMAMTASFDISRLGDNAASICASAWLRKMLFFYDRWIMNGSGAFVFSSADILAYEPSPEWTAFEARAALSPAVIGKIQLINSIGPC